MSSASVLNDRKETPDPKTTLGRHTTTVVPPSTRVQSENPAVGLGRHTTTPPQNNSHIEIEDVQPVEPRYSLPGARPKKKLITA